MKNNSLRTFGLIWTGIFFTLAMFPAVKGNGVKFLPLYISFGFLAISLIYPRLFEITQFYQKWIKFGDFIGKINSKLIIFVLFYAIFLPIGLILKIFRKDLLGKKIDGTAKSYFIDRKKQPEGMENQF